MKQDLELSVERAVEQSPAAAKLLAGLARTHRQQHTAINTADTRRHWEPAARTYCYQTHIAVDAQLADRLAWVAQVFYNAASLRAQPWYPQFLGGLVADLEIDPPVEVARHQLCAGKFDLGVGAPRWYRQLVSLVMPDDQTRIIVARSVDCDVLAETGGPVAYTLDPNGEVFYFEGECLHWHHICCTPGAGLLPPWPDRVLINMLRKCSLDSAERNTYRAEAEQLRDWLQAHTAICQLDETLEYAPGGFLAS